MTKVLINDAFGEDAVPPSTDTHDILYGRDGFTDALSGETFAALVRVGAIVLGRTVQHGGGHTRIFVSVEGEMPDA